MQPQRDKLFAASLLRRSHSLKQMDYRSRTTLRQANSTPRALNASGENRLKLGVLLFPRNNTDLNFAKPTVLQQLVQLHFAEPEPAVRIKLARFVEAMTQQIEYDDAAVLFHYTARGRNRPLRLDRMMQSLAQ